MEKINTKARGTQAGRRTDRNRQEKPESNMKDQRGASRLNGTTKKTTGRKSNKEGLTREEQLGGNSQNEKKDWQGRQGGGQKNPASSPEGKALLIRKKRASLGVRKRLAQNEKGGTEGNS